MARECEPGGEGALVVLSRARPDREAAGPFESGVLELLVAATDALILVADDLYDQKADAGIWSVLQQASGALFVLGWRYPRALYWLLRTRGVEGERADAAPGGSGRPIYCLDLRNLESPAQALQRLEAHLPPRRGEARSEVRFFPAGAPRWYPILDLSRCTACGQCREFCLFGVYERRGSGPPLVVRPDRCKTGCPACSRICPAHAILFPDHEAIPAVAGADTGEIPAFDPAELAARMRKRPDPILDVLDQE